MTSPKEPRRRPRLPLLLVPFSVYVGVTVIAPALNGATQRDGFWEHAAITVAVSGLMTWIWLVCSCMRRRLRGSC